MNKVFERYNAQPNYVSYLVTSSQHCYFPASLTYTADTSGTTGGGQGGQVTLAAWAAAFPVASAAAAGGQAGGEAATACDGELLAEPDWTGHVYCDAAQQGKVYAA